MDRERGSMSVCLKCLGPFLELRQWVDFVQDEREVEWDALRRP
jgi:hypothetical protein